MTGTSDYEYYARRAREERQQVELAADICAKRAHIELAEEYDRRARAALEILGPTVDAQPMGLSARSA